MQQQAPVKIFLDTSRAYSLPITIMSWLVAFVWPLINCDSPNILAGLLALAGIAFAHLAANLFDDYFDYKILSRDPMYLECAQNCKCLPIKDGSVTHKFYFMLAFSMLTAAAFVGLILTIMVGVEVIYLSLVGLGIVLLYSPLSRLRLGEVAVFITFGPLLFEGVNYVMTQSFSYDVLILSFAMGMMTVGIVYTHMMLDTNGDIVSHKKTLCTALGDKAIWLLYVIYTLGYTFAVILALKNNYIFLVFLSLPFVVKLCRDLKRKDDFYPLFFAVRNIVSIFSGLMIAATLLGAL